MDYKIDIIQQHPFPCGETLNVVRRYLFLLEIVNYPATHGPDMKIRRPGGNYEKIGNCAQVSNVQDRYVVRLVIVQCLDGPLYLEWERSVIHSY